MNAAKVAAPIPSGRGEALSRLSPPHDGGGAPGTGRTLVKYVAVGLLLTLTACGDRAGDGVSITDALAYKARVVTPAKRAFTMMPTGSLNLGEVTP